MAKGLKAAEEVAGEIDYSGLKHLISFQKDQFNIFQSSSEPFPLEYEGVWEQNYARIKGVLYDTYTNQEIEVDTSSSRARIDGIDFAVFHMVIHAPTGEIIVYQDMYSSHINGFDFAVTLNYNNDKDKETLMAVWEDSKFRKTSAFAGLWVNKKYVEKLRTTGSPRESQNVVPTSMVILPYTIGGKASIIWGFHEGTNGILKENKGQLGIYTTEGGEADFLLSIEKGELKMRDDTFVKSVARIKDDYRIAEEFLLSGKYLSGDTEVELTPDGRILGIDSLNRLSVVLDYQDAGMQVDLIDLGLNDQMKTYGFTFKGNELIVYHLNCLQKEDNRCMEVAIGEEYLALTRK